MPDLESDSLTLPSRSLVLGSSVRQQKDLYCVSPLPDEGMIALPEPKLAVPSLLEAHNSFNEQLCLDVELNCQNCINLQLASVDSLCKVDADIEKGNLDSNKVNDETSETLIFDGTVSGLQLLRTAVCRQVSLEIGGKLMQILLNYSLMLLRFTSREKPALESPHDTPNHRWRKYKRSPSFDSRKVVILFSALSSMGTLVLIYLTLRVRQSGGGFDRV